MDTIGNYKNRALSSLKGNWDNAVIATLVYLAVVTVLSYGLIAILKITKVDTQIANVVQVLYIPLGWGYAVMFLNHIRGGGIKIKDIFGAFNSKDYTRVLLTMLLQGLIILLGMLLLIVPGIILALMYSQTYFIMKDDPEMRYMKALKKSAAMMQGHKWEYFKLMFSFIGWVLLSAILWIGVLWLNPYMYTTTAHYYEDLKAEEAEEAEEVQEVQPSTGSETEETE